MEALFIIPCLVSPNVNEKLVPLIAKLVERNIALQNYSLFRAAILRKYMKGDIYSEGEIPLSFMSSFKLTESVLTESILEEAGYKGGGGGGLVSSAGKKTSDIIFGKDEDDNKGGKGGGSQPGSVELSKTADKLKTIPIEGQMELPRGITFFGQISPEPTILELPLNVPIHRFLRKSGGTSERLVRIGFKCVPYSVKRIEDILFLLQDATKMGVVKRLFLKGVRTILSKIPFTDASKVRAGIIDPEAYKNIIFSPPYSSLSSSKKLAKVMSGGGLSTKLVRAFMGGYTPWSTMVVLSSFDLNEEELKNIIFKYNKLVKYVFGDIVVVNETKENLHLCSARSQSCNEIPFNYLKQIMNLTNVLDYSEVQAFSKPFSRVSFNKVVEEAHNPLYESVIDIIRNK